MRLCFHKYFMVINFARIYPREHCKIARTLALILQRYNTIVREVPIRFLILKPDKQCNNSSIIIKL